MMRHHRHARDMVQGPTTNEMAKNLIYEHLGRGAIDGRR